MLSHSLKGTKVFSLSFWSPKCSRGPGSTLFGSFFLSVSFLFLSFCFFFFLLLSLFLSFFLGPYYFWSVSMPHRTIYTSSCILCIIPDPAFLLNCKTASYGPFCSLKMLFTVHAEGFYFLGCFQTSCPLNKKKK